MAEWFKAPVLKTGRGLRSLIPMVNAVLRIELDGRFEARTTKSEGLPQEFTRIMRKGRFSGSMGKVHSFGAI